ncbi:hypothetical protein FGRMN_10382 [Fusarium graminum]|nr:hypothetical protein FGRMN_10382 [Fusarium graminum]
MSLGQAQQPDFPNEDAKTQEDLVIIISDDDVMEDDETPVVRKRRGRPLGSKNKISRPERLADHQPYARMSTHLPTSDGEGIANMSDLVDGDHVPQTQNDSAGNGLEKPQFSLQEVTEYGAWVPTDKFERRACPELCRAFRQGVRLLIQRNEILGAATQSKVESSLHSSHPGLWVGNLDLVKEKELRAAWDSSLTKAAIQNSSNGASEISAVWKLSFNLFGLDPLSLLSMYHNLEFDNSGNSNEGVTHQGDMRRNTLWTYHFCHKLKRIMTHPMFSSTNSHRFIPIAIRWAVMCRTNDHHGFSDQEQRVLDYVQCGDLGRSTDLRSTPERFREHQTQLKANGFFATPQAELLLRIIEHTGPVDRFAPSGIAPVKTCDLGVVVGALDSLNGHGMSMTCETHYQVNCASRKWRGYPSGLEELLDAYKKSWMNIQRRKIPATTQTTGQHESNDRVLGYGEGNFESGGWDNQERYPDYGTAGTQYQEKHSPGSGDCELKNNVYSVQGAEDNLSGTPPGFDGREMPVDESQLHQDCVHPDRFRQIFFPNHPHPTARIVSERDAVADRDFMGIESLGDEGDGSNREASGIGATRKQYNTSRPIGSYNFDSSESFGVSSLHPTYHTAAASTKFLPGGKRSKNRKLGKQQRKKLKGERGGQAYITAGAKTVYNTQRGWNNPDRVDGTSLDPPTGPRAWRAARNLMN